MDEEINTNNFYCYFPGDQYRELIERGAPIDKDIVEKTERIIKDLDQLIEEHEFDLGKFTSLRGTYFYYQKRAADLGNTPNKPPNWLEQSNEFSKMAYEELEKIERMIHPIYKAMLGLGYSRDELVG